MLRSAFSQKPVYEFFLGRRQQGQRKVPLHFRHVHVELSNVVVRSLPEDARYLSENGSESHSFFGQPIFALAWPGRKVLRRRAKIAAANNCVGSRAGCSFAPDTDAATEASLTL